MASLRVAIWPSGLDINPSALIRSTDTSTQSVTLMYSNNPKIEALHHASFPLNGSISQIRGKSVRGTQNMAFRRIPLHKELKCRKPDKSEQAHHLIPSRTTYNQSRLLAVDARKRLSNLFSHFGPEHLRIESLERHRSDFRYGYGLRGILPSGIAGRDRDQGYA